MSEPSPKKVSVHLRLDERVYSALKEIVEQTKKMNEFATVTLNSVTQSLIVIGIKTMAKVNEQRNKEKEGK